MTSPPGPPEPRTRELERHLDALNQRFATLTEQVAALDAPPPGLLAEAIEDLSTAVEELEVAAEELHAQNEALTAAELHLDAEATRYRELFDLAPDGYLVTDGLGVILEANQAATAMFGTTEALLVGKPVIVFVDEPDRRAVLDGLGDATSRRAGAVVDLEVRYAPPDAPAFPASVRLTASLVAPGGVERRVRWLVRDVTEREASVALQAALEREQETSATLRDIDAAKDSILLAVAHDLRSPVASASGLAELLLERLPVLSEAQIRELGQGIVASTRQLNEMLGNLLDVERLAGGPTLVRPQRVDLTALARGCADELGLAETAASLPPEPVYAEVDAGLTNRIVANLLSNAVRHASGGEPPQVRITEEAGAVTICVDDDGPGVPDSVKESVFDAFERRAGADGSGLGLGLYLVRRFAELQRGRAWVQDRPAGGASFRVTFPAAPNEPGPV